MKASVEYVWKGRKWHWRIRDSDGLIFARGLKGKKTRTQAMRDLERVGSIGCRWRAYWLG